MAIRFYRPGDAEFGSTGVGPALAGFALGVAAQQETDTQRRQAAEAQRLADAEMDLRRRAEARLARATDADITLGRRRLDLQGMAEARLARATDADIALADRRETRADRGEQRLERTTDAELDLATRRVGLAERAEGRQAAAFDRAVRADDAAAGLLADRLALEDPAGDLYGLDVLEGAGYTPEQIDTLRAAGPEFLAGAVGEAIQRRRIEAVTRQADRRGVAALARDLLTPDEAQQIGTALRNARTVEDAEDIRDAMEDIVRGRAAAQADTAARARDRVGVESMLAPIRDTLGQTAAGAYALAQIDLALDLYQADAGDPDDRAAAFAPVRAALRAAADHLGPAGSDTADPLAAFGIDLAADASQTDRPGLLGRIFGRSSDPTATPPPAQSGGAPAGQLAAGVDDQQLEDLALAAFTIAEQTGRPVTRERVREAVERSLAGGRSYDQARRMLPQLLGLTPPPNPAAPYQGGAPLGGMLPIGGGS